MSVTELLTRETPGGFATVKDFPLTNEEIDTNWITLAENKLEKSFNLSDLTDVAVARDNLELGSIALQNSNNVTITGGILSGIFISSGTISGVDLQFTPRTLWGQTFDGSNNVNGNIVGAGTIQFGTQTSKATLTYTTNTARTLTVPSLAGNRTFAFINEAQTFTGTQTFSSTISGSINGNANTATTLATARTLWGQSFDGSSNVNGNIVGAGTIQFGTQANKATLTYATNTARTLTVPALGGNRTFAFIDQAQTFSAAQTFSDNVQIASLGVGTAASGTAGEIRATNDITAFFSDDRLKTRLGNIEDAVDKVETLSAFFYEPNETAQELGYKKQRYVGLSAQEVEKILPEVIKSAPIDDKYKTIQYEKLVPLLVAAIKELKQEINILKDK
jgi:hypothetical protein